MRRLSGIGEAIGALIAIPFTILVFYLLYLVVAWSWGFLLSAAGVALVGMILLSIGVNADEARERAVKRGTSSTAGRFQLAIVEHLGRGLATSAFAIAVGLVCAGIFQGLVLSRGDDIYVKDIQESEDSILYAKLWLDRVLGLDVLAGILALVVALSLLLPMKSLVERTLSVRRVLSFVALVLLTLTSFTFFAGLALQPYELSLRQQLRIKTAGTFEYARLDQRKDLVAMAWLLQQLEQRDPPPEAAERLRDYLTHSPYDGEVDSAAWHVAGFSTPLYFSEGEDRRRERYAQELESLAQAETANEGLDPDAWQGVRSFVGGIFGDAFAGLKADDGPQAWHYQRIARAVGSATGENAPLTQARKAGLELLTSLIADKLGGAIASEGLAGHFAGELVQAVVTPLWDVILPLGIKDVASAKTFVASEGLARKPLDWSKAADMPPLQTAEVVTPQPTAGTGPSTGIGATSQFAVPMTTLPSWQSFDANAFVYHPQIGVTEVYTRPVFRIR